MCGKCFHLDVNGVFDQIKAVLLKSNLRHGTKIKNEGLLAGEWEVTMRQSERKNPTAHTSESILTYQPSILYINHPYSISKSQGLWNGAEERTPDPQHTLLLPQSSPYELSMSSL